MYLQSRRKANCVDMADKTVLIVDDEKDMLDFLAETARRLPYNVITASSGAEAVELARTHNPNLIMLDVFMPDMSGDDVADILSRDSKTADIPLIFITGLVTKNEEPLAKKAGRHYVLAKPATTEEILALIQRVI